MKMAWNTLEEIKKETNLLAIKAMAFMMWGNCYLEKPPEYFGEWMVIAGDKLGYAAIPENLKNNPPFLESENK
jgi:hypothetical protein